MNRIQRILIDYLQDNLGKPKINYSQLRFNCAKCDSGNKYNLEVNCNENSKRFLLASCWACRYGGYVQKVLKDYGKNDNWKLLPEFISSIKIKDNEGVEEELKLSLPSQIIPYHLNAKIKEYLTKERGISEEILRKRNVSYVFDEEEKLYNHILFPFYDITGQILLGFCALNFLTKKYKNFGKLNYVPYQEFLDVNYPIVITEGALDAQSSINSIPLLNTHPNKAVLEFCSGKDIILALDSEVGKDVIDKNISMFNYYGVNRIYMFDLENHKDLNKFHTSDQESLKRKLYLTFQTLIETR